MTHIFTDALDALTDNSASKMSHMKRLGHVRSAVVHYYGLRLILAQAEASGLILAHILDIFCQIGLTYIKVKETGGYGIHRLKHLAA